MPTSSSQVKVQCTLPQCHQTFDSVQDMRAHQMQDPSHHYCGRCDEEFADEERLLIHKIKSNKHIICPICGLDFRSEGGRNVHIRQNHRAEQNMVCVGCQDTFKSATGLMRHIEENECPEISSTRLLQEQSKKMMIKQALKGGETFPKSAILDPTDLDDIDGGVKINEPNRLPNQLANKDSTRLGPAKIPMEDWPKLYGKTPAPVSSARSDLMAFSEVGRANTSTVSVKVEDQEGAPSVVQGGDNWDATAAPRGLGAFGVDLPDPGQTLRMLKPNWDATKFFNSYSGLYQCPGCSEEFKTMREFEQHFLSKSHGRNVVQCPGCFKYFKTTAALVAHCEAPTTRCEINGSQQYGQIIDELTGGVIQANGYNMDGTIKYEAGQLELQKTTTIGVDLEKIKW